MKSILLTTTALVAFAGAAAADGHAGVSFSGSATLGYNDTDNLAKADDNDGFYADMELDISMVAALDNGITVTATADFNDLDAADNFQGVTLEIASEMASLTFGNTAPSADKHWSGVDGSAVADFNSNTDHDNAGFEAIMRGEATMAGVTGSISYGVNTQEGATDAIDAMQLAAVADLGGFTVIGAYQAEFGGADAIMGLSVAGAVAGVDVKGAYEDDGSETSMGISASVPFGAATVGGYFTNNENSANEYGIDLSYSDGPISISADFDTDDDDTTDASWEIDANYDTGMGAIIHAGLNSGEDYYVAATYDLGGGASLLVSYVEDAAPFNSDDEIGEDDLQAGTTVEVSFSF